MTTSRWLLVVLGTALATGCDDRGKRTERQLEALRAKQLAQKTAKEEPLAAPVALPKLDPPYDDASTERLVPDGACPEGLWALFSGDPPGDTPDEKKANGARKESLAKALSNKRFLVRLRAPDQVTLKPHDAAQGALPVEVLGSTLCRDALGSITIAWTDAKAGATRAGDEVSLNAWLAPPVTFTVPIKSMGEAKRFRQDHALGLVARVVFTFGKAEVDKKLLKVGRVSAQAEGETVGYGGGAEDWGAGRLVRANVIGLRVAVQQEQQQLYELKGPGY
ncbi:MAG: hypothetical protein INH41_07865 [Myxococcaceae bacterium]|jgi:hypothetical protein|nr:hypothetical protein [Myxococcaceae bacterium]